MARYGIESGAVGQALHHLGRDDLLVAVAPIDYQHNRGIDCNQFTIGKGDQPAGVSVFRVPALSVIGLPCVCWGDSLGIGRR